MQIADVAASRDRVLVVEDDHSLHELLAEELTEAGMEVRAVRCADAALAELAQWEADILISDLKLPGADGLALLQAVSERHARPGFVIITAFGSIEQAVEAIKAGADDFLTKPLDFDHLLRVVNRVLELRRLRSQVQQLQSLLGHTDFHGMIGHSRPMRVLFDHIRRVAPASGPVLIQGESGTGKEHVARAIHAEGPQGRGPFLAVNCAGIPAELLESEFFGHEAGAFTGAARPRKGLFAAADGGTLLLDEVGEMPLALQAKLLRVLEDGRIRPVGSNREQQVNVRIVAATHRDLEALVDSGDFREDLFFRLDTLALRVPALRERGDDLELLAAHFLSHYAGKLGKPLSGFSPAAIQTLRNYPFPGNVRELQNAVQRAAAFCPAETIEPEHLPGRVRQPPARAVATPDGADWPPGLLDGPMLPTLQELQHRYVQHVLSEVGGNKRRAAALLGIGRRTLYRWLASPEAEAETEPEPR